MESYECDPQVLIGLIQEIADQITSDESPITIDLDSPERQQGFAVLDQHYHLLKFKKEPIRLSEIKPQVFTRETWQNRKRQKPPQGTLVGLQNNWREILKRLKEDIRTTQERIAYENRDVERLEIKREKRLLEAHLHQLEQERSNRERIKFRMDIASLILSMLALVVATLALMKSSYPPSFTPPQPEPLQRQPDPEPLKPNSATDTPQPKQVSATIPGTAPPEVEQPPLESPPPKIQPASPSG